MIQVNPLSDTNFFAEVTGADLKRHIEALLHKGYYECAPRPHTPRSLSLSLSLPPSLCASCCRLPRCLRRPAPKAQVHAYARGGR